MPDKPKNVTLPQMGLIVVALILAGRLVITYKPSNGMTQAEARRQGYSSLSRYKDIMALQHDPSHPRDLSEADFALIKDVLHNDGNNARNMAVMPFKYLRTLAQKRRAMALIKPCIGGQNDLFMARFVLMAYARDDGRVIVEELAHDVNPAVREMAQDVLHTPPPQYKLQTPPVSAKSPSPPTTPPMYR